MFPIASWPPLPPLHLLPLLFPPSLPSSSSSSRPPPLPAAALPPRALPSFPCSRAPVFRHPPVSPRPHAFPSHLELQSRPLELQSSGENLCRRLSASPTGLLRRLRACNGAPCREKSPKFAPIPSKSRLWEEHIWSSSSRSRPSELENSWQTVANASIAAAGVLPGASRPRRVLECTG